MFHWLSRFVRPSRDQCLKHWETTRQMLEALSRSCLDPQKWQWLSDEAVLADDAVLEATGEIRGLADRVTRAAEKRRMPIF